MNKIDLYNDPEFEQKFVLLQYASKNGKYVNGETVGIKVCGTFPTREKLDEKARELFLSGNVYFPLEPQEVGKWIAFPDYAKDDRKEVSSASQNSGFLGDNLDINKMFEEQDKQNKMIKEKQMQDKNMIKQTTYFGDPDKKEDLESLIGLNMVQLERYLCDYEFYKQAMSNDIKEWKVAPETYNENDNVEVDPSLDYFDLLKDPPSEQKYVLFSYTAPGGTNQRSDTLCFKIRGAFSNMEDFKKRQEFIFKKDAVFDLCKIPVGEWVVLNTRLSPEEASDELNMILGEAVKKHMYNKKKFEKRIELCRKKTNEEENCVVRTKKDIEESMDFCKEKMRIAKKEMDDFYEMLMFNLKKHSEKFDTLLSDEIRTLYSEIKSKYEKLNLKI